MAKKRIKIGLNEHGLGQVFLDDVDISAFVERIDFRSERGETPQVRLTLRPQVVDIKADAEVVERTLEPQQDIHTPTE